jgi:hypothetical protein
MKRVTVFYADKLYEEGDVAQFHQYPDGAIVRVRLKNSKGDVWWEIRAGSAEQIYYKDLSDVIKTYVLLMS